MEELYRQYVQIVYRFLVSACRDPGLAEDLTQETFLRAWESLERFDHSCRISTWLCQIAKHVLYQHWEKYGRERPAEPDLQIPAPEDTESQALRRVELAEVLEAFWALGPDMRQVVSLRAMEGLAYKEIGRIMGKSENWARVTYFRAKEILAREAHHEDF
ncbi:RNA polymerase sigma factor [Oscillibacter sp.]|jgi:RNA polymerase sigma factor (sigma-70 family)|uniref:RNA polymerase sigma factor n=1 Tax=Oscillibacter sp. TaxID=1945593 RepID=UPI00216F18D8|nr:RNA polymerase sigma factor [Oscillibacter sp.]MCI9648166.1 RNA polymerase sigma factor [Oscillibacter sp.]